MGKNYKNLIMAVSMSFLFVGMQNAYAQKQLRWHASFGLGATDVRNFGASFSDYSYELQGDDFYLSYDLHSAPSILLSTGVGVSGDIKKDGILTWDAGVNIRTAGFRLKADLNDRTGNITGALNDNLPNFDYSQKLRYWAAHVPLSVNYLPFEVVGFTIGADLYYQFSENPTNDRFPHGRLGQSMGFSSMRTPKYQHPFQLGGHLGVFAPIGEKLRLDLTFLTDLSPRLEVRDVNGGNWMYREIGLMLNLRYNLN